MTPLSIDHLSATVAACLPSLARYAPEFTLMGVHRRDQQPLVCRPLLVYFTLIESDWTLILDWGLIEPGTGAGSSMELVPPNFHIVLWYSRPRRQAYCSGRAPTCRWPEGVESCITNPSSHSPQLPHSVYPWSER
jgi:hypothetical protein